MWCKSYFVVFGATNFFRKKCTNNMLIEHMLPKVKILRVPSLPKWGYPQYRIMPVQRKTSAPRILSFSISASHYAIGISIQRWVSWKFLTSKPIMSAPVITSLPIVSWSFLCSVCFPSTLRDSEAFATPYWSESSRGKVFGLRRQPQYWIHGQH